RVPGLLQWVQLDRLRAGHEYRVWLSSSTSLGDGGVISDPLNFTTPEDVPSDTVHNLSARLYGSTAVVISWDPPLEPNGRVFYQLSLQEAGITHPSINRTENQTITKTTTDTVFLFTKLRKYFPYVLRVTPATSAGPALDHTSVLHLRTDDDVPSSAPLLSVSRNLSSTSILVSWYAPVEPNGEIIEYTLVLQGPRGYNSTYTSNSELILTHLTPYTAYNLSISAVNRKGMGPSLMLPLHTDEAGPMSPPRNLSIFNHSSDSVWLHWEPSLEPNGVIQHYGFKIVELNTDAVIYQNSTGSSTQAELHGFKPHSSYEISVSTYTRAGNGDQYSLPVTFTTLESVSEAVGNLSCSGLDWDSVYMEWKPPENPNGEILLYHIVSAHRRDEVFPLMLPDKLVYTFSGLLPDTLYVISVAAVNSAGLGEESNCTAQTLSESVPDPPELLSVVNLSSDAVSLSWLRPARVPGHLRGYRVHRQRLALACEMEDVASCVESEVFLWVNATQNGSREVNVTLQPLLKYRRYRVRVVAWTNAGAGKPTDWMHIHTLAGSMSYTHNGCFALTGENIWHQFRYSETRSKFE
ncbi:phosphatidylinositol phosphatase PTPRQ isoform X1, partial [Tachysurus ichikawai]